MNQIEFKYIKTTRHLFTFCSTQLNQVYQSPNQSSSVEPDKGYSPIRTLSKPYLSNIATGYKFMGINRFIYYISIYMSFD